MGLVLVRFYYLARIIVNADHSVMSAAATLRVVDCIRRLFVPEPPEWQRIGDYIDSAFIFTRANFVKRGSLIASALKYQFVIRVVERQKAKIRHYD